MSPAAKAWEAPLQWEHDNEHLENSDVFENVLSFVGL